LSLAIIALWLGTSGWLAWHDLWPRWRPGQPPPYTIDLTAEVHHRHKNIIYWTVEQNDRQVFRAETWVESPAPEVFELKAMLRKPKDPKFEAASVGPLKLDNLRMESTYRIRQGRLLGIEGKIEGKVEGLPGLVELPRGLGIDFVADVNGEVREGQFFSSLRGRSALLGKDFKLDLQPVPVSDQGSVLLPLHPVNRIQGLRPGQTWRIPVMNPLLASARAALPVGDGDDGTRYLQAEVLPSPQLLTWKQREVPCLVIRYRGDEMTASTWVEEDTGLVLRQEAAQGDESWVMQRD